MTGNQKIKNPVLVGAGRGNHQYETLVDSSGMHFVAGLHKTNQGTAGKQLFVKKRLFLFAMRLCILFLLACFFFSCSGPGVSPNPQGPNPVPASDSTLLFKFIGYNVSHHPDTAITETYFYDSNKRISVILTRQQFHNHPFSLLSQYDTLQFLYTANDTIPQRIIHKIGQYRSTAPGIAYNQANIHKFGYDVNGRIIFDTALIGGTSPVDNYDRYVYLSNTAISQFSKTVTNGVPTSEFQSDYLLTYSGNNLFQQNLNGLLTYQLSFDNKVSPFSRIKGSHIFFPYLLPYVANDLLVYRFSRNNILESRYYIYGPAPATVFHNYSYTYRGDGFPLTMTRSISNNSGAYNQGVFIYY